MLIVQCILFPFLCNVMPPQLRLSSQSVRQHVMRLSERRH